ncbi:NlpC/P60 family protein [Streptomyces cellulosae]|uniref:NlpC/P60 family protein n=2 Tax=Streptomyces TaxID=1883 RepID=A0ABU3JAL6_9ACTN|nr:NlpC/P60 family protein [Streptomyces sp. McG7]MDQ0489148.1 cell wall-associated NlpC family hydrolase [Streptomyces thermodiastaticus]MDT6972087.1 NlpC/P60 family protein [Streptomyces thermocarboxydus]WSB43104.1 NlpC/P60 family protein [Streptomyces cellulosae]UVT11357.1 C40 family peptidase [Streptomyces thermocarboxydus]
MAAHRRSRQRPVGGTTARAAVTVVLAGAATAAGFDGAGHAAPRPTPSGADVDRLYREAEVATEKYNGVKEKADSARRRLRDLQDETARAQARLNKAREALGTVAAAQYRSGGLDPALRLMLSDDPDAYLDGAALAERAGSRHHAELGRVRAQLREIEKLRGAARVEVRTLTARRDELGRHRRTITEKLSAAREALSRMSPEERARITGDSLRAARSAGGTARDAALAQAPNARAAQAVAYARQKLGSPYVWGATGPDAFDCSGLVLAAYRSAGVSLPRTTYAQIDAGRRVSPSELLPGDLVFFYSGISHVGLYIGNGQMIHAPNPSAPVRVAPVDQMPFAGATRVV